VSGARTGLRSVDAAHRGPSLLLVFAFRLLQLVMQVEQPQSSHNGKTPEHDEEDVHQDGQHDDRDVRPGERENAERGECDALDQRDSPRLDDGV